MNPEREPIGHLATLSLQALLWASRAPTPAPRLLRHRLYNFNRLPITPAWRARLPDRRAVIRFLGADREVPAGWRRCPPHLCPGWVGLERMDPAGHYPAQARAGPFKLYISPRPDRLPTLLENLWPLLSRIPMTALKIADSVAGLLRPDKLVVYSPRLEWVEDLSRRLLDMTDRPSPHGVPFSAEIGGGGLLSWGADRHAAGSVRSWRSWLVDHLADELCSHVPTSHPDRRAPPWRRALEHLQLQGVDIERWQPRAKLWLPLDERGR